jgi:hypothetical protein
MNETDRTIREALGKEDAELMNELKDDPSIFVELINTYRGRRRWLTVLGTFLTLVFLALAILCAIRFFGAETTQRQIMWATGCVLCVLNIAMLKIWVFLEMNRNAMMRELKRIELQMARLETKAKD